MIYAEFINRDRQIPSEIYRYFSYQEGWDAVSNRDKKVVNIARTKGFGGQTDILCLWRIADISRLDEWEAYFRNPNSSMADKERAAFSALEFHRSGLFDEIIEAAPLPDDGLHYVEYFDSNVALSQGEIRTHFQQRAKQYTEAHLNALLLRIGLLGPDPGGIAIWTFPNYTKMEAIVREQQTGGLLRPKAVGVFRNVGFESI